MEEFTKKKLSNYKTKADMVKLEHLARSEPIPWTDLDGWVGVPTEEEMARDLIDNFRKWVDSRRLRWFGDRLVSLSPSGKTYEIWKATRVSYKIKGRKPRKAKPRNISRFQTVCNPDKVILRKCDTTEVKIEDVNVRAYREIRKHLEVRRMYATVYHHCYVSTTVPNDDQAEYPEFPIMGIWTLAYPLEYALACTSVNLRGNGSFLNPSAVTYYPNEDLIPPLKPTKTGRYHLWCDGCKMHLPPPLSRDHIHCE